MKRYWIALCLVLVACSDDKDPVVAPLVDMANNVTADMSSGDVSEDVSPDIESGDCTVEGCSQGLLCNENTGLCVACQFNTECGENGVCTEGGTCECETGFHDCAGVCVSDMDVATCGTSCTPCPTPTNGIATCDGTTCGVTCDAPFVPFGETCGACSVNADCTNPFEARCDAGTCVACSGNADCAHQGDADICSEGSCVECASNADCQGNVCATATGTCTQTAPNTIETCEPCDASGECVSGHACVPMNFQGAAHGSYCLPVKDAEPCPSPWVFELERNSTEGSALIACGPNESVTTCEAVMDLGSFCPTGQDSACGAPGLNDGRCEPVGFDSVLMCTYSCTSSAQCREVGDFEIDELACLSADYCGGF